MNVLNWIQQEKKVADYHVVTWRFSHFHHPINRTSLTGQISIKPQEALTAASGTQQQQLDGIGLGLADNVRSQYKAGGLGTDGLASDGVKDAVNNKVMSTDRKANGNQTRGTETAVTVVQTILPSEVYSVVESARQSALKVQSRIKQGAAKLRDIYQKQSGHTANTNAQKQKNAPRRQPEKEQRGTRHVSKDEVLSMQAENHYLLDSYDRNGQYSMLSTYSNSLHQKS